MKKIGNLLYCINGLISPIVNRLIFEKPESPSGEAQQLAREEQDRQLEKRRKEQEKERNKQAEEQAEREGTKIILDRNKALAVLENDVTIKGKNMKLKESLRGSLGSAEAAKNYIEHFRRRYVVTSLWEDVQKAFDEALIKIAPSKTYDHRKDIIVGLLNKLIASCPDTYSGLRESYTNEKRLWTLLDNKPEASDQTTAEGTSNGRSRESSSRNSRPAVEQTPAAKHGEAKATAAGTSAEAAEQKKPNFEKAANVTKAYVSAHPDEIKAYGFRQVFSVALDAESKKIYDAVLKKQGEIRGDSTDKRLNDGKLGEITYGKLSPADKEKLKAAEAAPAAAPAKAPEIKEAAKSPQTIPTIKERPAGLEDRSPALGNPFTEYTLEAIGSGLRPCDDPEKAQVGNLLKVKEDIKIGGGETSDKENDLKKGNLVEVVRGQYKHNGQTVLDIKTSWGILVRMDVENLTGTNEDDLAAYKQTRLDYLNRQKEHDRRLDAAELNKRTVKFTENFESTSDDATKITIPKDTLAVVKKIGFNYYEIQRGNNPPILVNQNVELPVTDVKFDNAQWYAKISNGAPITARGEKSHKDFYLKKAGNNEAVAVLMQTEDRYLIRTSDGREGWTLKTNISEIVARNERAADKKATADIAVAPAAPAPAASADPNTSRTTSSL